MNMLFRCASRLIAVGAFALIVPTLASASDVVPGNSFKLAMGPMSAAQKNQSQGMSEKSDAVEIKPHHIKPHHHTKHRHHIK